MPDVAKEVARLEELRRDSDAVQTEMDDLVSAMERVPPEQRPDSDWGPEGALTKRFLALSQREKELAAEIRTLARAIEQASPTEPNA